MNAKLLCSEGALYRVVYGSAVVLLGSAFAFHGKFAL